MIDSQTLRHRIDRWCTELGFAACRITDLQLAPHVEHLRNWLDAGRHGEMDYMQAQFDLRANPARLLRDVSRAIVVRMDYQPQDDEPLQILADPARAYVSRYALGRDYHKVMRPRLGRLAQLINRDVGKGGFRACVDSAPVFEKALAERAGLGWFGKNTLILSRRSGSLFFLGVLLTDLPLPIDPPHATEHCGTCRACLDVCPTQAFVGPRELDARRCISYLTIEHRGSIPLEMRPLMGNRVFGCDDCQLVCPWNRFAQTPLLPDFAPRNRLENATLLELFAWTAEEFDERSLGSPLRRIGYEMWQRNLAIALGNAPYSPAIEAALSERMTATTALVREHCAWALSQQRAARENAVGSDPPIRA